MNQGKFNTFMQYAKSLESDYGAGYQRGLRRYHHGEAFGTEDEHDKWLNLDGYRQDLGDGYRDGFAGKAPRGLHGLIGSANAQKYDLPCDTQMQIRLNSQLKAAFVKQAQRDGIKLSEWVLKTLSKALD